MNKRSVFSVVVILLLIAFLVPAMAQDIEMQVSTSDASSGFSVTSAADDTLFRVRGDGNVGIGTASPSANLDIRGTESILGDGESVAGAIDYSGAEGFQPSLFMVSKTKPNGDTNENRIYGIATDEITGNDIAKILNSATLKELRHAWREAGMRGYSTRGKEELLYGLLKDDRGRAIVRYELTQMRERDKETYLQYAFLFAFLVIVLLLHAAFS